MDKKHKAKAFRVLAIILIVGALVFLGISSLVNLLFSIGAAAFFFTGMLSAITAKLIEDGPEGLLSSFRL